MFSRVPEPPVWPLMCTQGRGMSPGRLLQRLLILAVTMVLVVAHHLEVIRPAFLNWGATAEERQSALPGDDIVKGAATQATRAITIRASMETVWPWLAQLGQDRGGFYSFDLLENLVGCDMPVQDVLRPDRQVWNVGDRLWMYPSAKAGGAGFATLRAYEPGRALGFATRMIGTPLDRPENGSWSHVLTPIDAGSTRLLVRGRGTPRGSWLASGFDVLFFDPIHFAMERRMLIGLSQVAETGRRARLWNDAQVMLWLVAFGMLAWSAWLVMRRPSWRRPLIAVVAAAAIFQLLTLMQPPIVVGLLLLGAVPLILHERRHSGESPIPGLSAT